MSLGINCIFFKSVVTYFPSARTVSLLTQKIIIVQVLTGTPKYLKSYEDEYHIITIRSLMRSTAGRRPLLIQYQYKTPVSAVL